MRILLFGMNGQVGWELQRSLAPLGELVMLGRREPPPRVADFLHPDALHRTVLAIAPQVIVNAAAYTAVDAAETESEMARTVNATAPARLAAAAATLGAWLLHYSTDHVFDGSGTLPWTVDAPTAPLNAYGRTKLEGEEAIRAIDCKHLILRTSWVHSVRGNNFARRILQLAAERDTLDVVVDQFGAPTGADLLADVTAHALRGVLARPALAGTYHVAAGGETSRHAYARHLVASAHAHGMKLQLRPERVRPIPSSVRQGSARRPLNGRLDSHKLMRSFDLVLPDWRVGVERMLQEVLARADAGPARSNGAAEC